MTTRLQGSALALVCMVSGASGLIYQAVWTRRMTLVVGSAAAAVSLVLAVFMGGLALGSWRFGRAADESRDPLRLYGRLELAIAAFGLLSVPALEWLAYSAGMGPALQAALACAALLLPAVLMGGTLPVLIKAACPDAGGGPARLYALNTLGAVAGTLLATFALIETAGLRATGIAAAMGNLAAAAIALLLARGSRPVRQDAKPPEKAFSFSRTALAVAALSGFLGLASEVLWTRYLILVVGDNSVYAFGTMLAAYLAGLVAGGAAASRLAGRVKDERLVMGAALALGGAATLASAALLAALAGAVLPGDPWSSPHGRFLKCLAILLVPAAFSGALLPVAAQLQARGRAGLGGGFGAVFAVNTAGAIAGALAGGFVILPWLGVRAGLASLAGLGVAAGLALLLRRRALVPAAACAAAVLAAAIAAAGAGDPGRRLAVGEMDLVFYKDGPESTVSIGRARSGPTLTLFVDWRDQAATGERSQIHLRLLGHLPALLHAAPKRALVIALGSGVTAGSLTRHPLEAIDVVELSRGVIEAAPLFAPFNHAPLSDPRVRLVVGDGRQFLRTSGRKYDIITTDPINPESAGAGNLYSKEFYELVRSRLDEGGVACQWIPSHYLEDEYRLLVRTFSAVFPNASVWYADGTTVLVGFKGEPRVDLAALRRRWTAAPAESLALGGIDSPETMLSLLLAGPEQTRRMAGSGPLITDDRPRIEYRSLHRGPRGRLEAWEVMADLGAPDAGSVVASWSPSDEKAVAGRTEGLRALFSRRLRRSRAPAPDAPEAERALFLEEHSRRFLDGTWKAAESAPAPIYRMMAGLPLADGPARRAVLAAARADRGGEPVDALDRLLEAGLSSPELEYLPHRMVDMVIRAMERRPRDAAALGRRLLERLPAGRNRPRPEEAGDVARWRLWWTGARFGLAARAGRFVWLD